MDSNLKEDKDKLIKEAFKKDRIISAPSLKSYQNYIHDNHIRVKKYTRKTKISVFIFVVILFTLLYIAVNTNILEPFREFRQSLMNIENEIKNVTVVNVKKPENIVENTSMDNTLSNTLSMDNTIENKVVLKPTHNIVKTDYFKQDNSENFDINFEELNLILESYSVLVGRENGNDQETNTAILEVITRYFNKQTTKMASLSVNTTYAKTYENFDKFVNEATTKTIAENMPIIDSYFKYHTSAQSFTTAGSYINLSKEVNTVSDTKIAKFENGVYTGTYLLNRKTDTYEENYKVLFTMSENDDYTYAKYKIESIEVEPIIKDLDKSLRIFATYGMNVNTLTTKIEEFAFKTSDVKSVITPEYIVVNNVLEAEASDKTNAETYVVCFDIAYTNGTLKASMPFKADVYFTPNNGDIQVKKIYKD